MCALSCPTKRWRSMKVVYLAPGHFARDAETSLISFARRAFPERCRNCVADSRGVTAHVPAFVYMYI